MNAKQKIQSARTALVLDQPFFGALILMLKPVADETIPMAATDGTHLIYNPEYVERIPQAEVLGLMAEEVGHCALGHIWRRSGRHPVRWNVACDLALCHLLKEAGFDTGDMIYDPQYAGKSAEWIYDRLPQQPKSGSGSGTGQEGAPQALGASGTGQPKAGKGQPSQGGGGRVEVRDAPSDAGSEEAGAAASGERPLTEGDWQRAVQQAALAAKSRGQLPAGAERFVNLSAKAKVDWRTVLHRFVQQSARDDYSWHQPSRRFLAHGIYLPAIRCERCGPIAVVVDTSGSIDAVMLNQFAAELRSVIDDVRPTKTHVIWCDAAVHRVDEFEPDDVLEFRPVGGGGTVATPALDYADNMEEPPSCLIYLTDLDIYHRAEPPSMPILWVSTQAKPVPYGEVVVCE